MYRLLQSVSLRKLMTLFTGSVQLKSGNSIISPLCLVSDVDVRYVRWSSPNELRFKVSIKQTIFNQV